MSYNLATLKRLLSEYYNQLEILALGLKNDGPESNKPKSDEESALSTCGINSCFQRWEDVVNSIEKATTGTKQQLEVFSKELGKLAQPSLKMTEEFDEHLREVIRLITIASDYMLLLQVHIDYFKSFRDSQSNPRKSDERKSNEALMANFAVERLPTSPIPTFSGDIDEWDTFWEFFSSNVHSQPLPEIYKLNYLLCALKGEALESIKMFQITRENYHKVVDFLRKKYGNAEELMFRLTEKLESCSLRSTTISDKRKLLEQLVTITAQLNQKGENFETQLLVKQLLLKFPHDIQRKVFVKKQNFVGNNPFRMQTLLQFLEEVISNEEMLAHYARREPSSVNSCNSGKRANQSGFQIIPFCMHCKENQKSVESKKHHSPQERFQCLQSDELCLICSPTHHSSSKSGESSCYKCQRRHHTSCYLPKSIGLNSPCVSRYKVVYKRKTSKNITNQNLLARLSHDIAETNKNSAQVTSEKEEVNQYTGYQVLKSQADTTTVLHSKLGDNNDKWGVSCALGSVGTEEFAQLERKEATRFDQLVCKNFAGDLNSVEISIPCRSEQCHFQNNRILSVNGDIKAKKRRRRKRKKQSTHTAAHLLSETESHPPMAQSKSS